MSSTNSPFEQSVRGAAYIYTSKSGSKSIRPPQVSPVTRDQQPLFDQSSSKLESGSPNSNIHRPPSASSTAITTKASEAIKLALKKLSERNLQDKETQRVSHLAQQLAKVWSIQSCSHIFKWPFIKGSPDPSHFIFEINVGKIRIRHRTTLK